VASIAAGSGKLSAERHMCAGGVSAKPRFVKGEVFSAEDGEQIAVFAQLEAMSDADVEVIVEQCEIEIFVDG
jgi:hypothetical protein